ncbi:SDR family oxidoreductase [Melittangium boletus]|uniref:SDR family oxidoreductase n=1 Tax=Melittangium boletus TaxID=83453 RepID=UPI003DA5637F
MRVFVTGATGFIGSAIVQELIGAGHEVLGLARSDAAAQSLVAAGARVHRGQLDDLDSLKRGAADSEGVIHTAFIHDFSNISASGVTDRIAIEAMGEVLAGSNRPFVVTSGLAGGRVGTEDELPQEGSGPSHRLASDRATLALASRGVRVSLLRLPPSVHGDGDHAFVPALIGIARAKGVSAYPGEGRTAWSAVHRLDAAHLYRLALEKGQPGAVYHGIADEGVPTRELAEVIGRRLKVPVVSKSLEDAAGHFGWLAPFFTRDMSASSTRTRARLGWQPQRPGLLADLEHGHYFDT